jgi:hypothetical protein
MGQFRRAGPAPSPYSPFRTPAPPRRRAGAREASRPSGAVAALTAAMQAVLLATLLTAAAAAVLDRRDTRT